jgi:hypothetical protein
MNRGVSRARATIYSISVDLVVAIIVNWIPDKSLPPLVSRWIGSNFRPEQRRAQCLGSEIALPGRGFAGRTHGYSSP